MQTATSVGGQVEELTAALREQAELPVVLIGHSWGAWLGYLLAARHPALVRKLILVASGPFEARYVRGLGGTRLSRLTREEQSRLREAEAALGASAPERRERAFSELGRLMFKADSFDPIPIPAAAPEGGDDLECRLDIYQSVWPEAAELRRTGRLLELGRKIECPVVAIHGDYDPHQAEGVAEPLGRVLGDFRLVLLEKCGHTPWFERQARERFYQVIRAELGCPDGSEEGV